MPLAGYARNLWLGELPLSRAFWHDMLFVGTLINLAGLIAAILLFVAGAPIAAFVVHTLPVPYNFLLLIAVWQSAGREAAEWCWLARLLALGWTMAMFVV